MKNRTLKRVGDQIGRVKDAHHQKRLDKLLRDPGIPEQTRQAIAVLSTNPQASDDELIAGLAIDTDNPYASVIASMARSNALAAMQGRIKPGRGMVPQAAPKEAPLTSGPLEADYTIQQGTSGVPLTSGNMTADELKARRIARVEAASFTREFHEVAMLWMLRKWILFGPMAFVALTSGEIAFVFAIVGAGASLWLIWGGALFVDLCMMFCTFLLARTRRRIHELRASGSDVPHTMLALSRGLAFGWSALAIVNMIGQVAFLTILMRVGSLSVLIYYAFIGTRVFGFIIGDAVTAFLLPQVETDIELVAREDERKGKIYLQIAQSEGERRKSEAQADMAIKKIDIEIEREQRWAEFHAELDKLMIEDTLRRQRGHMIESPEERTHDNDIDGTALPV